MIGATTVCCSTRQILLSIDQLLKTKPLYPLQAVMTVGDVFMIQNLDSRTLDTRRYKMVSTMMLGRLTRLQSSGLEEPAQDTCSKHYIQHHSDNISCSGGRSVQQTLSQVSSR